MRDDLHGFTQIFAGTFLVQHMPIYLAGGEVGEFVQVFVDKSFVVAKVKVGFRAIVGYINLAVLERAHCARIHIDIRIKLLRSNLQAAAFQ